MTKTARLMKLLQRQYATPLDALNHCGVLSLAQRVSEFRAAGVMVADKWVICPSGSRVKAYHVLRGAK